MGRKARSSDASPPTSMRLRLACAPSKSSQASPFLLSPFNSLSPPLLLPTLPSTPSPHYPIKSYRPFLLTAASPRDAHGSFVDTPNTKPRIAVKLYSSIFQLDPPPDSGPTPSRLPPGQSRPLPLALQQPLLSMARYEVDEDDYEAV